MINLLKKGLLLAVLLTAVQSYATKIPAVDRDEYETAMLTFMDVKQGNKIQVKDMKGTVIYKEKVHNVEEFENRFNLSFLPDGQYLIELVRKKEVVVMPVEIADNQVAFYTKAAYVENTRKIEKPKTEKSIELEKGIQRRQSSFKGGNYLEYIK